MWEWIRMAAPKSASVSGFSEPPMNGASVSGIRPAETSLEGVVLAVVEPYTTFRSHALPLKSPMI